MICDIIDIDKFLTKSDFITLIRLGLRWPWTSTHFILSDCCFGCGFLITNDETKPAHFILTEETVKYMIIFFSGAQDVLYLPYTIITQMMNVNIVIKNVFLTRRIHLPIINNKLIYFLFYLFIQESNSLKNKN